MPQQLTQEQFGQLQAEYEKTITPESVKSEADYNAGLDRFINKTLNRQAFEGMEASGQRGASKMLPIAGSAAAGILAAPFTAGMSIPAAMTVGGLAAGAGGAAGEAGRQKLAGEELRPRDIATTGAIEGVSNATGTGIALGAAKHIAPRVMKAAFGTQAALRNKFPGLDLERLALDAGTTLTNAGAKATRAARNVAGKAVGVAARAADAMGVPKIRDREVVKGLAPLYDEMRRARLPESQAEVLSEINRLRQSYATGSTVEDALIGKTARQNMGQSALPSSTNPRSASLGKRMDAAEARSLNEAARKRSPAVASALDKSQETILLDRASKAARQSGGMRQPLSRTDVALGVGGAALGGGAGAVFGDNPTGGGITGALMATLLRSPAGLSILAQTLKNSANPVVRESIRMLFEGALAGEEESGSADQGQPR